MAFGLIEIDSKIIKFELVGPDIYHFIERLAAILEICKLKKLPLGEI